MINSKKLFKKVTGRQLTDFGLTAILVTLFLALCLKEKGLVIAAFALTLITVIASAVFYPFAAVWFGLSAFLGRISTTVLTGLLFFLIVVPVGLCRKLLGRDSLKIRQFKKGRQPVMTDRNHAYTKEDLLHTF